jgi:hypothetical protein
VGIAAALLGALTLGLAWASAASGASAARPARPSPVLAAACAGTLQASTTGTVVSDALTEISGIASSRRNRGVYWVHNDSGDSARVFAIDAAGRTLGEFALDGAQAVDWEDIAVAPGPGQSATSSAWSIYVADIGDNTATRASITVYRVPEPAVAEAGDPVARVLPGAAVLTFTYPDGAHDAEALLVDPRGHDLLVVTKDLLGGRGLVYRGRADGAAGSSAVLERVGRVSLGPGQGVTGGDVTADGSTVALRTYLGVRLYPRPAGTPLWRAFAQQACTGAAPPVPGVGADGERQGEAIAFVPGARAYLTVSEGTHPSVHRFGAARRSAAGS